MARINQNGIVVEEEEELEIPPDETPEEVEDESPDFEAPHESENERHARELGWHPKDEYLGPPHKWVDADTFMKRGREVLPLLRENNRKLLEKVDRQAEDIRSVRQAMADSQAALTELREMARTANQRGYEKAVADLKAQQREAVASGDMEAFDKVSEQIEETTKARATAPPPDPSKTQKLEPEVVEFVNSNPWFNNDTDLNRQMQAEHVYLRSMEPTLTLAQNLEKAAEKVKQANPTKFGRPASGGNQLPRRAPVAAPSGGVRGPLQRRGGPIDRLEVDDDERSTLKAQFAKLKRSMPDYSEEEFAAVYADPHADILTVQRSLKEKRNVR